MSQQKLAPAELHLLRESFASDCKDSNIRLREGEYQYGLAKAIASYQLELQFPDVRDIVRRLHGENRVDDIQFIRRTQTILKKMEKSNVLTILQKKKPWELQRYALLSFKFQDVDKNMVVFATEQEIKQAQYLLSSAPKPQTSLIRLSSLKILGSACIVILSYLAIVWTLIQPIVNPVFFIPAFTVAVASSLILGKVLSGE